MKFLKRFSILLCCFGLSFSFLVTGFNISKRSVYAATGDGSGGSSSGITIEGGDDDDGEISPNAAGGNIGEKVPIDGDATLYIHAYFHGPTYCDELKAFSSNVVGEPTTIPYVSVENYINESVTMRPPITTTTAYNTVDYLYYMLGILEYYAKLYLDSPTQAEINNLMLGYLRSFDNEYDQLKNTTFYGIDVPVWDWIAGEIDEGFCTYVKNQERNTVGLSIPQFFASFVQTRNNYRPSLLGTVNFDLLGEPKLLQDPLGSGQGIDLIHMFASMDGIYDDTGSMFLIDWVLREGHQQDIVSWLGDLQTFTVDVYNATGFGGDYHNIRAYQASDGHIDFNEFVKNGMKLIEQEDGSLTYQFKTPTSFSSGDLLADIDAMNITRIFIDHGVSSLRDCIMAYYKMMKQDNSTSLGNRYYEFIYTCTRSLEWNSSGTLLTDFQREVYRSLNLERTGNYVENASYYDESSLVDQIDLLFLKDESGNYPNLGTRRYCANLFYDYITIMSHRFD